MSSKTKRTKVQNNAEISNNQTLNVTNEKATTRVPVSEEYLLVDKQWVKAGEVIIRKEVQREAQTIPVELAHDEVAVERVPVNRYYDENERPQQRQEGDTIIIPLIEEQIVVVKRYFVREEVRVTRRRTVTREELSDTVRRETLSIETGGRVAAGNESNMQDEPGRA